MNIVTAFVRYQAVRFPLRILIFTTGASVLCSAAILHYETSVRQILLAFLASMFFLFHIRVLDESRDFKDDSIHTPESPLHSGIITFRQLICLDLFAILFFAGISGLSGYPAILLAASLLLFTSLAWKDFFMRRVIIKRKVLYHLINSPQMILLQLSVFSILTHSLHFPPIVWLAVAFVYVNIFVLEVVRKIKVDKGIHAGSDTYNAHLGFRKSVILTYCLAMTSFIIYFFIIQSISGSFISFCLYSIPVWIFLTVAFSFYLIKQNTKWQSIFLLATLIKYIGLNVLICLSVL